MKIRLIVFFCAFGAHVMPLCGDNLWVRHDNLLRTEEDFVRASNLVERASKAGLNALVLGSMLFDTPWVCSEKSRNRLLRLKRHADACGMEIIPHCWSVGYGSMCNIHDDLVETVAARDQRYVAKGNEIVPLKEPVRVFNGDLERYDLKSNTFDGWYTDGPGVQSFVDTEIRHSGKASLRVEPGPGKDKYGHGRIAATVGVIPGRRYRLTAYFRAENLKPVYEALNIVVNRDDGTNAGQREINRLDVAEGWRKVSVDFQSEKATLVNVFCGTWGAKSGRFWVDDITVEETGIRSLSCRKGTPLSLRNAVTGKEYRIGVDFSVRKQPRSEEIKFDRLQGSAIKDGEKLLLDAYVWGRAGPKMQLSTCLSDPKLYDCFKRASKWVNDNVRPKKWFLSLDELRNGGTCPLCEARQTDMAHIFGEAVTKMHGIIKADNPDAQIYAWSDMFDPNHNAKDRYLGCKGTFRGVWDLIPKDIVMVLWWRRMAEKSAAFFTERGFDIMGSVCTDFTGEAAVEKWKSMLGGIPQCRGFMYTTWSSDYGKLKKFGEIMGARKSR